MLNADQSSERRRIIHVFAELGNRWPFWESGDGIDPTPTASDLGLSVDLSTAIAAWYDHWEAHHHWERGWDTRENEALSWAEGSAFIRRLRVEVAAFADVVDRRT